MPMSTAIKALREKYKLSRMEFAAKLGVSYFSVIKWELGYHKPSKLSQAQIDRLISTLAEKGEVK